MPRTVTETTQKHGTKTKPEPERDIRQHIVDLINLKEKTWFEICELAAEIYDSGIYTTWKDRDSGLYYQKAQEYAKDELGMEYRTFMWCVQMGHTIKHLGLKKEQIDRLSWTKFKELSSLLREDMSKEEISHLFDEMKDKTFREVQEFVKQMRLSREGEGPLPKLYKWTFELDEEQNRVFEEAQEISKELFQTTDKTKAFEGIITDFVINNDPERAAQIIPLLQKRVPETPKVKHNTHAQKGRKKSKPDTEETGHGDSTDIG